MLPPSCKCLSMYIYIAYNFHNCKYSLWRPSGLTLTCRSESTELERQKFPKGVTIKLGQIYQSLCFGRWTYNGWLRREIPSSLLKSQVNLQANSCFYCDWTSLRSGLGNLKDKCVTRGKVAIKCTNLMQSSCK